MLNKELVNEYTNSHSKVMTTSTTVIWRGCKGEIAAMPHLSQVTAPHANTRNCFLILVFLITFTSPTPGWSSTWQIGVPSNSLLIPGGVGLLNFNFLSFRMFSLIPITYFITSLHHAGPAADLPRGPDASWHHTCILSLKNYSTFYESICSKTNEKPYFF